MWSEVQILELVVRTPGGTPPPRSLPWSPGSHGGATLLWPEGFWGDAYSWGHGGQPGPVEFWGPALNGVQGTRGRGSAQVTGLRVMREVTCLVSQALDRTPGVGLWVFVTGRNGHNCWVETELGVGGVSDMWLEWHCFYTQLCCPIPDGTGDRQKAGGSKKSL